MVVLDLDVLDYYDTAGASRLHNLHLLNIFLKHELYIQQNTDNFEHRLLSTIFLIPLNKNSSLKQNQKNINDAYLINFFKMVNLCIPLNIWSLTMVTTTNKALSEYDYLIRYQNKPYSEEILLKDVHLKQGYGRQNLGMDFVCNSKKMLHQIYLAWGNFI